jgi:hypothetical protein
MSIVKWTKGRQNTGYLKKRLISNSLFLPFDLYILKFPENSYIPPHIDLVDTGKHYRLNIVLKHPKRGGEFICKNVIFENKFIKLFRPDENEHSLTEILEGTRYVLSMGWVL